MCGLLELMKATLESRVCNRPQYPRLSKLSSRDKNLLIIPAIEFYRLPACISVPLYSFAEAPAFCFPDFCLAFHATTRILMYLPLRIVAHSSPMEVFNATKRPWSEATEFTQQAFKRETRHVLALCWELTASRACEYRALQAESRWLGQFV